MALKTTEDSIVFACYARSCAPPPVGKGGSTKGGRKGGGVIRKSGGGDSSVKAGTSKSIAKAITERYGTRGGAKVSGGGVKTGSTAKRIDTQTRVSKSDGSRTRKTSKNRLEHVTRAMEKAVADKNRPGGIGGGSAGRAAKPSSVSRSSTWNKIAAEADKRAADKRKKRG